MRNVISITIGLSLLTSSAFASELSGTYGNTVVTTDQNGVASSFYINEDNTYTGDIAGQTQISGTWAITNGQACFNTTGPDGTPIETCSSEILGKNVGDNWTSVEGSQTFTVTIVAGR